MKIYTSEAKAELKKHLEYFDIEHTKENITKLCEIVDISLKLGRNGYIPDRLPCESVDTFIMRVHNSKGLIDAIQIAGRLKGLRLKQAKEYVYNLRS